MSERPVMQCLTCKYDLSGLPDGVCPECGAAFSLAMFEMMEQVKADGRIPIPVRPPIGNSCATNRAIVWFRPHRVRSIGNGTDNVA